MKNPDLEGRAFERLMQFAMLSAELQEDTKAAETYLTIAKGEIFQPEATSLVKSVWGVRGKVLIEALTTWLTIRAEKYQRDQKKKQQETEKKNKQNNKDDDKLLSFSDATAEMRALVRGETPYYPSGIPNPAVLRVYAKKIAEALVLHGFLKPYKDNEKNLLAPLPIEYISDNEVLLPIAKSVSNRTSTSVWDVVDGAIYAKCLKRKAGVLSKITQGKDTYVIVNAKTQTTYLFKSDLARVCMSEWRGNTTWVELDASHFDFGVKLSSIGNEGEKKKKPVLLNVPDTSEQEMLLHALLSIGMRYREEFDDYDDEDMNNQQPPRLTDESTESEDSDSEDTRPSNNQLQEYIKEQEREADLKKLDSGLRMVVTPPEEEEILDNQAPETNVDELNEFMKQYKEEVGLDAMKIEDPRSPQIVEPASLEDMEWKLASQTSTSSTGLPISPVQVFFKTDTLPRPSVKTDSISGSTSSQPTTTQPTERPWYTWTSYYYNRAKSVYNYATSLPVISSVARATESTVDVVLRAVSGQTLHNLDARFVTPVVKKMDSTYIPTVFSKVSKVCRFALEKKNAVVTTASPLTNRILRVVSSICGSAACAKDYVKTRVSDYSASLYSATNRVVRIFPTHVRNVFASVWAKVMHITTRMKIHLPNSTSRQGLWRARQ